jgi:hypothetical protein
MIRFLAISLLALLQLQPATALVVRDLDGRTSTPLTAAAGTANLIFFLNTECPISARYSPEIDRIASEYAKRGVKTWLVYADPKLSVNAARANLKEFHPKLSATVVIDTDFALTKTVDATVTPEAAIYTSKGRVYRGRIDDLYLNLGQPRRAATQRDVRVALDAILTGKPVPAAETTPVGCYIERK